ncbi:MAG: SpoIIE family protein phosphatase [Holophagaceae bacterium]|nr:SpoIIE family protein phosphatase [Holophagaceae bacterium]
MSPELKRIRWRLILSSLIALGLSLGTFYATQWAYAFSDDQCTWKVEKDRIMIREILPAGVAEEAGMLEGDQLVGIQGRKFQANAAGVREAQNLINARGEGTVLVYTVVREGKTLYLPLRLVKPLDVGRLIQMATGLLFWLLGLLVVVSSPQRKISRLFFYLSLGFLLLPAGRLAFQGNVPGWLLFLIFTTAFAVRAFLAPLVIQFFLRFPHPFPLRKNRRFMSFVYGYFILDAIGNLVVLLLRQGGAGLFKGLGLERAPDWLPGFLKGAAVAGIVSNVIYVSAFAFALVCFIRGTLKVDERRRRSVLPALLVALALSLDFIGLFWMSALPRFQTLIFQRQAWIFLAPLPLLPLAFAYAVVRHGLFDIRRTILRWVAYFAILGAVVALYFAALAWIFGHTLASVPPGWAGVLVGLSALPIGWALRRLLLTLRRFFRRDQHTARQVLLGSLRESQLRLSDEAFTRIFTDALREAYRPSALHALPVLEGAILLPQGESAMGRLFPPQRLAIPPGLIRHARENRELILGLSSEEAAWILDAGPELRAHVDALEVQVMMLVMVDEQPAKAILMGGKYAELNYGREDRELLREAAIAAGLQLEAAALHRRLLDQGRLEQELQTARLIQENLVTSKAPEVPGFSLALRLDPAMETGGDILWVRSLSPKADGAKRWLAAVGDVSGKGMAAALYMSQAMALLEFATQQQERPLEEILHCLDTALRNLMGQRDFLTLALLEWDEFGRFRLARAGHPPAVVVHGSKAGESRELSPHGRGLGLRPAGPCDWEIAEGVLAPREWIVLHSDGLTEAMSRGGELYGLPRFIEQLQRFWGTGSARAACEALFRDVSSFEAQNRDDRTLLILARESA